MKPPTLAIIGPGRCGKDTAGEWLRDNTILRFEGGCSWAARHYMAERLTKENKRYCSPEGAYENRHSDRGLWYKYLNEYRKDDPAKLIRLVLETSDFVCGIRDWSEYKAARDEGLIDLAVWVERPGIPHDPTLNIARVDCDIVIENDFIDSYLRRWRQLAGELGILRPAVSERLVAP